MITGKPSQNVPNVLTFDGEALEDFYGDRSQRVHITQITGIQLTTDRKGNHELIIRTSVGGGIQSPIDVAGYGKANELVAAVQSAMASFRL
jgi:hypothetical protein